MSSCSPKNNDALPANTFHDDEYDGSASPEPETVSRLMQSFNHNNIGRGSRGPVYPITQWVFDDSYLTPEQRAMIADNRSPPPPPEPEAKSESEPGQPTPTDDDNDNDASLTAPIELIAGTRRRPSPPREPLRRKDVLEDTRPPSPTLPDGGTCPGTPKAEPEPEQPLDEAPIFLCCIL